MAKLTLLTLLILFSNCSRSLISDSYCQGNAKSNLIVKQAKPIVDSIIHNILSSTFKDSSSILMANAPLHFHFCINDSGLIFFRDTSEYIKSAPSPLSLLYNAIKSVRFDSIGSQPSYVFEINLTISSIYPLSFQTNISFGQGARPIEEIRTVVMRHIHQLKQEYDKLCRTNSQSGKIMVRFTIDPNGDIIKCDLVSSSFEPSFNNKILSIIKTWKFEASSTYGSATITYPFAFTQ